MHWLLDLCSEIEKNYSYNIVFVFRYNTRHVALKVAYLGWDYNGFVVQEDTEKTIEAAMFEALLKTRLVESRLVHLIFVAALSLNCF